MIVDLAEAFVTELFVERTGLKGERIQPDADAAVFESELLGLLHKGSAESGASEFGGNRQILNEEPVVRSATPETADGFAVRASNEQRYIQEVRRRAVLK